MNKVLILFFSIFLFASSLNNELVDFDKTFLLSNKAQQLAKHQKLKTLYIKSIISDDLETKKEVLKRIILSSRVLKLDSNTYQKELRELGVDVNKISFKNDKTPSENIKEKEKTNSKKTIKENKIYITKVEALKNGVKLSFNGDLGDIKKFNYNTKEIKNTIFEFESVLDKPKYNFEFKNNEISVVQYNPNTARIVVRSKEEIQTEFKIGNSDFIIFIEDNKTDKKTTNIKKNETIKTVEAKQQNIKKTPQDNADNNDDKKQHSYEKAYILNSSKTDGMVVLKLNAKLNEENFKTFTYGKNQILEFDAVLNGGRKNYDFKSYSISVLQFNPQRVRVVLYTKSNHKMHYIQNDNKMIISIKNIENKQAFQKSQLLITLDAGHGGKDSGASAHGRFEKDITLAIVKKLEKALKNKGYKVFLTRNKDVYIGLRDRTKMANDKKSDLFISIHANSIADRKKIDKIYGIETYFLSPARSERSKNAAALENKSDIEEMNYFSKQTFLNFLNREKIISSNKLAIDIQGGILNCIPKSYLKRDGGVKEAPFWVLVGALMPAVLIEVGYITHPIEGKNIADRKYQQYIVDGIANGIDSYFIKNK